MSKGGSRAMKEERNGDCSGRKHTPIVSQAQAKLFGAVAGGKKTKASSLSKTEAKRHLEEMGSMKRLPRRK